MLDKIPNDFRLSFHVHDIESAPRVPIPPISYPVVGSFMLGFERFSPSERLLSQRLPLAGWKPDRHASGLEPFAEFLS